MRAPIAALAIATALALTACRSSEPKTDATPPEAAASTQAEATAIGRTPIEPAPIPAPPSTASQAELEAKLAEARAAYEKDPSDEDATIWLGRRLAYLGRYQEAIDVYTRGLALHPDSYKLLRHRGHRWITLRRFDLAEQDLARASELIRGVPDEVEPDGVPNKAGKPRGTVNSNVEYHLGLALYLQGRFEDALPSWKRCLEYSRVNDDMLCAATCWTYATLRRLGRDEEAEELLDPIHDDMDVIEYFAYRDLLLVFKGWKTPPEVMEDVAPGSVDFATLGYGLANLDLCSGDAEGARRRLEALLVPEVNRAAFGRIAAEVELARMGAPSGSAR